MPNAYWLIGPPGCGKSTWVKNHLDTTVSATVVVISRDALVEEWAAAHDLTYTETMEQKDWSRHHCASINFTEINNHLDRMFFAAAEANKNLIVDMTNMTTKFRLGSIPKSYKKHAIIFKISGTLLVERLEKRQLATGKYIPAYVVHDMIENYIPPSRKEFDEVTIIEQD